MPIQIISRNYSTRNHPTGNGFLLANSGQIVTETIQITTDFNFTTTQTNQLLFTGDNTAQLLGLNWSDLGVVIGDSITIEGQINGNPSINLNTTRTVSDIDGSNITVTSNWIGIPNVDLVGELMPSQNATQAEITNNTRTQPETIELFHNLVLNSSQGSINSLFDSEVNRFEALDVSAMSVTDIINLEQMGDKSGGSYLSYTLERLTDVSGKKAYEIVLSYANYLKFEDADFDEPSWFEANESLKPYYKINAYPEENNPNSALTVTNATQLGNVGWNNENYNQGVNPFVIDSVSLTDSDGNAITEVDYNQTTVVEAIITASEDFLEDAEIEFYLIPDIELVKNKADRNCDLIQLSNFHIDSTPTITENVFGTGGAEMQTSAQSLNVATSGQITISFELNPNTEFTELIESFNSENRRYKLTATVESDGGDENENNAVTLILKEGLLTKAPIIGGPFEDLTFQGFFNHKNDVNGVSEGIYNGCTEDDVLYKALFNLEKEAVWDSLNMAIQVVRDSDGQYFNLLSRTVNFDDYVTTNDGVIQINYEESLNQYLDSTDRNQIKVSLTGNEDSETYEVEILWSLLMSWRYWVPKTNALIDFFDPSLTNNGLNDEWMRYLRESGYTLRLRCTLTDGEETAYYFGSTINLQDYDDSATITTEIKYYDQDDTEQTSLLSNQIMTVKAIHTLSAGSWDEDEVWGWISERKYEADPNKRISTVWDWTSQNTPLSPETGQTKAKLEFTSSTVAVVSCLVDTSLIDVENVSFIGRIETPKNPECIGLFDFIFGQVQAMSNDESEYLDTLYSILKYTDLSNSNVCCPTCEMTETATGDVNKIFGFGNRANMLAFLADYSTSPCCADSYGFTSTCEANFDTLIDDFLINDASGPAENITVIVPVLLNAYTDSSSNVMDITELLAGIVALTDDEELRYNILLSMVTNTFTYICYEDGRKLIEIQP